MGERDGGDAPDWKTQGSGPKKPGERGTVRVPLSKVHGIPPPAETAEQTSTHRRIGEKSESESERTERHH